MVPPVARGAERVGHFASAEAAASYRSVYETALAALPGVRTRQVSTTHGRVQLLEAGEPHEGRLPVVLLHGLSMTSAMWGPQFDALAAERPVVAIDSVVDCGGSEQTAAVPDLATLASDTWEAIGERRVHLVGLSFGGWTAAGCAIERPEQVASLTLLEPAGTFARIRASYLVGLARSFVRSTPERWDYLSKRPFDADQVALLDASRGFRPAAPLPGVLSDDQLRRISVPTQVVLGADSTVCSVGKVRDRVSAILPEASLTVIPDAGHIVSWDASDRVNALIASFVTQHDR